MIKKQSGATLVVVLIFLIILTILGVASMSGSIIQQKSSTNVYLENEAFHVAESAVSALINADKLNKRKLYGSNFTDELMSVDPVTGDITAITPFFCVSSQGEIEQVDDKASCNDGFEGIGGLNAVAQIEFLDCRTCPGNEFGGLINCNAWKITGFSTVAGTTTNQVNSWVVKTSGCDASTGGATPII